MSILSGARSASASPRFATTSWTMVRSAGDPASPDAGQALASLCQRYWMPVFAFIRRWGRGPEDAEDLCQEFFARLIESDLLLDVDPQRGRFRTYLLACLQHFLANERDRRQALKRGGGRRIVSLTTEAVDVAASDLTPELAFERRFALSVLDQALARVRGDYEESGRGEVFAALQPVLTADPDRARYAQIAEGLAISPVAVKVAVHRLRRRFRECLEEEIARLVGDPADVADEIAALFRALRHPGPGPNL